MDILDFLEPSSATERRFSDEYCSNKLSASAAPSLVQGFGFEAAECGRSSGLGLGGARDASFAALRASTSRRAWAIASGSSYKRTNGA